MKKIIVALCLPVIILSGGCKKFLDEKPYSFFTSLNFPTSEEEADIALRGIYAVMQGYGSGQDYRMFDYSLPVITSEVCDNIAHSYIIPNLTRNEPMYEGVYSSFFQGINFANNLIAALEKRDEPGAAWVESKLAEAKAIRAYYYFWLVRMFSDVPLKLEPTVSGSYIGERTPVPEIYKQIVEDLKFAEDKLPNRADPDGRITKGGCKGILTQVYATMAGSRRTPDGQNIAGDPANWALARDKAREVLDLGVYTFASDYTQIFKDLAMDIYNPEMIFDVSFTFDGGADGSTFPYIFGPGAEGGAATNGGGKGSGLVVLVEWLRELEPDDKRIDWNIAKYFYKAKSWEKINYPDSSEWRVAKWRKWPDNDDSRQFYWGNYLYNWPLVRLADIKLLYAEAINEANNGPTAEAYQHVNDIRQRAGLADLPAGLTKEQFKDRIMNERSIEFLGEGMRHFDLVRWGDFKQMMDKRSLAFWMVNYGGVDEMYINAPIPQQELDINSWEQNK